MTPFGVVSIAALAILLIVVVLRFVGVFWFSWLWVFFPVAFLLGAACGIIFIFWAEQAACLWGK